MYREREIDRYMHICMFFPDTPALERGARARRSRAALAKVIIDCSILYCVMLHHVCYVMLHYSIVYRVILEYSIV